MEQTVDYIEHPERVQSPVRKVRDTNLRNYLVSVLGESATDDLHWTDTTDTHTLEMPPDGSTGMVNTQRINSIRRVNKYFEKINCGMDNGQFLVTVMESKSARKKRLLTKYPRFISHPYYLLDFILKRVFPKWKPTRRVYFNLTKGRNRVMSVTEAMGRLVCCGFDIIDCVQIGYNTCIVARKVKPPEYDMQPTYGALIRLERVGFQGEMFTVFKLRTMHPYSEYLQDFIFEKYDLKEGGKFNNDFRTTGWGGFFRKYWLDELPMFINYFRREMKLVGVRPLSQHYFELYPEDLREMRTRVKPGLVPPYYADMPKGLEEIQESERKYLEAYQKKPIRTDLRYLRMACVNILFRGARSS